MEDMLKKYWKGKEIVKYNYSNLKKLGVLEQDANLLSKCGLPKSAAPYLNFEVDKVQEKEKDYYNIGFTGSGDFICLEKAAGRVVYLDHEEEDEKAVLINSSLTALLESIFCYRKFVDKVNETGMWNYLNNNYSIRQVESRDWSSDVCSSDLKNRCSCIGRKYFFCRRTCKQIFGCYGKNWTPRVV